MFFLKPKKKLLPKDLLKDLTSGDRTDLHVKNFIATSKNDVAKNATEAFPVTTRMSWELSTSSPVLLSSDLVAAALSDDFKNYINSMVKV